MNLARVEFYVRVAYEFVCVSLGSFAVPGVGAWRVVRPFHLALSFSSSILPRAYHELVSLWSLYTEYASLVYTQFHFYATVRYLKIYSPQDGCRPKLVRNTSGSHSSNDKRHRADRVSVLLLLLLLFFFGYRMFKIHAAFLYIYNIYVSRSQSSRSRVPSHRTIPPPLLSFLRLFTPPERVPRTLLAHESLYTRSI